MEALKSVCPEDCIHYELGYKPRNAAAAGIRVKRAETVTVVATRDDRPVVESIEEKLAKRIRYAMASLPELASDDQRRRALKMVMADFDVEVTFRAAGDKS